MGLRKLVVGVATLTAASAAYSQNSIADNCAEVLVQREPPEILSPDERAALDAFEREKLDLVSVKDLVSQLPENVADIEVENSAAEGESDERAVDDAVSDYLRIRDWQNPIVIILSTGVEVRSSSLVNGTLRAPIGALHCILSNMPMTAWPHGRVVRANDSSIIGSFADLGPIRRNHEMAQAVFDELQVEVLWFPA